MSIKTSLPVSDFLHAHQVLRAARHFSALPAETTDALARLMIPHGFNAGQIICLEGEPVECVHFIERGWVKGVRTASDGRQQAALFLRDGDTFGIDAVFGRSASPISVVALENVSTMAIQSQALVSLTERHPALSLACLEQLSARVLYFIQLVEDLGLRSVQARIAHTLLDYAEPRDGRWIVPRRSWTTLDEMATRLGTVRDVLSRALNALEADGILRLERSQIIINDPQKLFERGKT